VRGMRRHSARAKRQTAHSTSGKKHIMAGEASEVLDGRRCWSRQDYTEFRKELDWELQAFRMANAKLELPGIRMDKRHAAHL
jgi:hypothetical protein